MVEIEKISLESIKEQEHKKYLNAQKKAEAIIELEHLVKEIGSKGAYRISGYVSLLKNLILPDISIDLYHYIKSCSRFMLRGRIKNFLIASYNDSYSSFALRGDWKRIKKGWFHFYWYAEENYVNVYTLPIDKIPLYLNKNFKDEKDREYLVYRLRLPQ